MLKALKYGALAAFGFAAISATPATPAKADAVSDFYKGRTVRITQGFSVGGTYGRYAAMFAQFLPRYIPGNPTVIAQRMPGAGGLKAANYAFNAMPKDGSHLLEPLDSLVIAQLLRPKAAKFKANEFTWLGNAIQSNAVIVIRSDKGINKLSDLKGKVINMAASGKGSQTFLMPALLNGLYGAKFKITTGYRGSSPMRLAMEKGEADGISLTWLAWRSAVPQWFKPGGFAKAIVQIGVEKEKELPNVPMFSDVVTSKEDKQIVAFMASMGPVGRGLVVPPGVPADRVAALRKAFSQMVADPEFIAEATKRRVRVNALSGEEVQKFVSEALKVSPELVKRAQKLILGK
jgi:tripartite-type tricarboxylate transporter receptor subunit TctC